MTIAGIRFLSITGQQVRIVTAIALNLMIGSNCFAALRHNYLFNSGDGTTAVDSVAGGANGMAVGGTIDVADSRFVLDGTSRYVDLPGSSIAINTYPSLTLESWLSVSPVDEGQYTASAAFGTTDAGGAGQQYIMMQPTRGGAEGSSGQITPISAGNEVRVNTMQDLSDGKIHHTVTTISPTELAYYVDGQQVGTAVIDPMTTSLAQVSNDFAYIGRSVWSGDPLLTGSIYEFRIYDDAKSATDVAALNSAGCQAGCGQMYLEVDRNTGAATLNNTLSAKNMIIYQISSAKGALSQNNWLSITNNYDEDNGGSVDPNDQWEIVSQTNALLQEQDPIGEGAEDGAVFHNSIALGNIWHKSPIEDFQANVTVLDASFNEQVLQVPVFFINGINDAPYSRSDFDLDGDIDTTDYVTLRSHHLANLGGTLPIDTFALGDINGDLVNDYRDFRLFKTDFIAANGAAAFASMVASFGAIPEPATLSLMLLGAAAGVLTARRRRIEAGSRNLLAIPHKLSESNYTMSRVSRSFLMIASFMLIPAVGHAQTVVGSQNFDTATLGDFQTMSGVQGARQYICCSALNPLAEIVTPGVGGTGNLLRVQHDVVAGGFNVGGAGFQMPVSGNISPNIQDYKIDFDIRLVQGEAYSGPLDFGFHIVTGASFSGQGGSNYNINTPEINNLTPGGDFQHVSFNLGNPTGFFFGETMNWNPLAPPGFIATEFNSEGGPTANSTQIYEIDSVQLILDIADSLALLVDPATGKARLKNIATSPVTFDYYRIDSDNGALLTSNFNGSTGWNSLEDQGTDAVGAGIGESWDEVEETNSANRLVEQFLLGTTTLDVGQSVSLGAPLNPATLANNLSSLHLELGGPSYQAATFGKVIFQDLSSLVGDYNSNGVVDAADYTIWRDHLGQTFSLQNRDPANGSGAISAADYNSWKANFGAALGAGSASGTASGAVPEPAAGLMCVLAICLAAGARLPTGKGRA